MPALRHSTEDAGTQARWLAGPSDPERAGSGAGGLPWLGSRSSPTPASVSSKAARRSYRKSCHHQAGRCRTVRTRQAGTKKEDIGECNLGAKYQPSKRFKEARAMRDHCTRYKGGYGTGGGARTAGRAVRRRSARPHARYTSPARRWVQTGDRTFATRPCDASDVIAGIQPCGVEASHVAPGLRPPFQQQIENRHGMFERWKQLSVLGRIRLLANPNQARYCTCSQCIRRSKPSPVFHMSRTCIVLPKCCPMGFLPACNAYIKRGSRGRTNPRG
jgi:hypothetical protein